MLDFIPVVNMIMQYLIVPTVMWMIWLHKEVAVLRAEAIARDKARKEERETFGKQLDQILTAVNSLNGRIDGIMRNNN